ncbi:cyclopropane fatty acid synthase [Russula brevipes]|nr:cyclopropane fatty acid synthase [Russula brevipes]
MGPPPEPSDSRRISLMSFLPGFVPSLQPRFTAFAKNYMLTALKQAVKVGYLQIEEAGTVHQFGSLKEGANQVHITVVNDSFWTRMFLHDDLGFSEAYMAGDIDLDPESLECVINLWLDNEAGMTAMTSIFRRLSTTVSGWSNAYFGQTRSRSRLNVIAGYDQSNDLYEAFLSKDMMYSSALWSDRIQNGGHNAELEAAQLWKIHHVLRSARIKRGHRVLEFGSGWGSVAFEAARQYGCEVDTLTLSINQKRLAEERIREAGLQHLVRVHLMDYRDIPPEFEKKFDAFVSVEMLEHVGPKHYPTYFKLVDKVLKSRNAAAVVTCSTYPESRYSSRQPLEFTRKYIWPNTNFSSAAVVIDTMNTATQGRFTLEGVENHSAHYARTIREWDRRFVANVTPKVLAKDFPDLAGDPAAFEEFRRKWRFLFAYAAAGMATGYVNSHMFTFIRSGDRPSK